MKFKNILFDLDGTLTDPFEGIANAVIYSLEKMEIDEPDRKSLRRFIGPPLVHSYMEYYKLSRNEADKAVEYYREFYNVTGLYQNTVYDKTEDMLDSLKKEGAALFVATSKPQVFAERVLKHFGLYKYFEHVEGVNFDNCEVEKDFLINNIINEFRLNKRDTAMVGDRKFDILSANKVGIASIGILHGYGSMEEFEESKADIIVKDTNQLSKLLLD